MTIEEMLHTPIVSPSAYLTFLGKFDPEKEYKTGDVVIDEDERITVRTGAGFEVICGDFSTETTVTIPKMMPKRCEFCGAPLVEKFGEVKCEYCGTSYK